MKTFVFLALILATSLSHATTVNSVIDYKCVADRLQAYDSDNYYNLSKDEIDAILADANDVYYSTVLAVANQCLVNIQN